MATASGMEAAIEPGSVPYGERQGLEEALGGLGQTVSMPGAGPMGAPPMDDFMVPQDPMDMMMGGDIAPEGDLTAGLSRGLGSGPAQEIEIPDSTVERLRIVALYARSPVLRMLAARALRGSVAELKHGN